MTRTWWSWTYVRKENWTKGGPWTSCDLMSLHSHWTLWCSSVVGPTTQRGSIGSIVAPLCGVLTVEGNHWLDQQYNYVLRVDWMIELCTNITHFFATIDQRLHAHISMFSLLIERTQPWFNAAHLSLLYDTFLLVPLSYFCSCLHIWMYSVYWELHYEVWRAHYTPKMYSFFYQCRFKISIVEFGYLVRTFHKLYPTASSCT